MANMHISSPRVSIGLPVYNGACYLEAALDSLLTQTYDDLELIISDNGSTDETSAICERAADRDRRVRFVRQPENRGTVWNFNHVVELARGEYFKWAAHDDLCAPTFVEQCVAALDGDSEFVLSFPRTDLINEHGRPLLGPEHANVEEGGLEQARPHERFRELLMNRVWVHEAFGLVRLAVLKQTHLLPRYVGAEKVLFAELAFRGTFHQVPETLFLNRWHSAQASWIASAADERQWRDPRAPRFSIVPYHAQCAIGHTQAILQAPISAAEKLKCQVALAQWMFQVRKWRRLAATFLRGWGSRGIAADSAGQSLNSAG